jgi:hypothetical protein
MQLCSFLFFFFFLFSPLCKMILDQKLAQKHTHPLLGRSILFKESLTPMDSARILSKISAKYKVNFGIYFLTLEVLNATGSTGEKEKEKKKAKKASGGLDGFKEPAMVLFDKAVIPDTWTFVKPIGKSASAILIKTRHRTDEPWKHMLSQCCSSVPDLYATARQLPLFRKALVDLYLSFCPQNHLILNIGRVSRCMLCIFQRHVEKCFSPSKRAFAPNEIVTKLKAIGKQFRIGRQEDSHEFIRLFIDALVKPALNGLDHLDHASKDTTLLHQIFGGHLVSQIHCLSCGNNSNSFEQFMDLCLEIMADSFSQNISNFNTLDRYQFSTSTARRPFSAARVSTSFTNMCRSIFAFFPHLLTARRTSIASYPDAAFSPSSRASNTTTLDRHLSTSI